MSCPAWPAAGFATHVESRLRKQSGANGWGLVLVLGLACAVAPRTAAASPPFELVGSTLGSGGFNARTTGASSASAYFNPALLTQAKTGLELGWFVLNDGMDTTLFARDPAVDVPVTALEQFEGHFPSVPTTWLQNGCDPAQGGRCVTKLPARPRQGQGSSGNTRAYQTFGLVSTVWKRYLTLGIHGMVPIGTFLQGQSFFADEREQYFSNSLHPELYSDRLTAMSLAFAAGSHILDWLSVGVGVTLSLTNTAAAGTFVGDSDHISESLQLNTKINVSTGVAPHFGLLIEPIDALDLSLTVHTPERMDIVTGFSTFLPNGDLQRAERTATLDWQPWTFAFGGALDLVHSEQHRFSLVATATYRLWSEYVNRQGERPLPGYGWSNTLAPVFGLRHVYDNRFSTFLDATYEPSPVPLQTGRTNYVDNDRYGLSGGVTYELPIKSWGVTLRFGAQGQLHILSERAQTKLNPTSPQFAGNHYSQLVNDEWVDGATDNRGNVITASNGLQTNNPGWPGFSSKGIILGAGVQLAILY